MTSYDLWLEPEVHHARKDLPGNFRQQVKQAIDHLATDPRPSTSAPFVAHAAAPEWLEAWAAEESKPGPMQLKEYAELYNIQLDVDAYRHEFPEDEPFTHPPADEE